MYVIMPAASSIYWNSGDSQRSSCEGSELNSSSSASSSRRRYVDPWDLENYAYLRRRQIEIKLPRYNEEVDASRENESPHVNSSKNDSCYWYPMPVIRETVSQDGMSSKMDDPYIGESSRDENTTPRNHEANFYPLQQTISYEDEARYVTPNPVYVPLSDIEYQETSMTEQVFPKILPRRRNRVIKNLTQHLEEECPCPFHGPLPADVAMAKEMGANKPSKKQLGLNTYGHLRIDYAKSWNSLHRKMKK